MSALTKRDKLIPWYFVLFFVVIGAVNAVMVTLAVRTHTGTVTDHPYEKGLAYNKVVDAANAQEKLGWKSDIRFEHPSPQRGEVRRGASSAPTLHDVAKTPPPQPSPSEGGSASIRGTLHLTLRDRDGQVLTPEKATASFSRPTQAGIDFTTQLTGEHTPVTLPEPGLWEVRVDIVNQGMHYQQTQRIVAE